jgi:hypothetical protein
MGASASIAIFHILRKLAAVDGLALLRHWREVTVLTPPSEHVTSTDGPSPRIIDDRYCRWLLACAR